MRDVNQNKNEPSHIIILNGVSSVGKTSVAKAIQDHAVQPFLHLQMDSFLEMLPKRAFDHSDGLVFDRIDSRTIDVKTGPIVKQTLNGMRHAIVSMAECGNHIIADDVFFGQEDVEYRRLLKPYNLRLVGLFASLEIVQKREKARGDRHIGLAKGQFERVHKGRHYDLEIDTNSISPEQIAKQICDTFDL